MRQIHYCSTVLIACLAAWSLGCNKPISGDPPPMPDHVEDAHDHSHDGHDHGHHHHGHSHADLGPNGGHLLELGNEQYHAEWAHDDESGKLTVFILDNTGKELVPIAAEKLTIHKTVGERSDTYELTAVDRQGETPKSAKFEITDKALVEALKLVGQGVEASLTVDVNGQPFTVKFPKHDDHHGHKH